MGLENKPATQGLGMSLHDYFKAGYILIVDDMPNMRRTIKNMLKMVGITFAVEAGDAASALDIMRNPNHYHISSLPPDKRVPKFVLMDWRMPRMTGIDGVREIRADSQLENLPVLLITAEITQEQIVQAGEVGVNGYIIKPFVAKTLAEKITSILVMRENPPMFVKCINKAEEYIESGKFTEAGALLDEAWRLRPDSARIKVLQGVVLQKQQSHGEAQAAFDAAKALNPKYLKAHVAESEFHLANGRKDLAVAALETASTINPHNADRLSNIGMLHLDTGNEQKAQAAFEAAIAQEPAKARAIAEECLSAGRADKAEVYFRKSLPADPRSIPQDQIEDTIKIYNRLGISLRRQGKWQDSILEYKNALKVDPKNEGLYFNMAKAHLEGNEKGEAEKCFAKAIELDPTFTEAKTELDRIRTPAP